MAPRDDFDASTMAGAFGGAGIDPRQWTSYGVVENDNAAAPDAATVAAYAAVFDAVLVGDAVPLDPVVALVATAVGTGRGGA